ncbi:hypothetical protein ACN47E_008146 [Coniothyrium glycines]
MSSVNTYTAATPGDFFCPAGGKWYACETGTKFIGCCLSDPCKNGCFADQLRPAGVSTTIYNQYPGGSCGGNTDFWTCLAAPTFWGCCNSDPCQNNSTCRQGDLEPTFMDRPDQLEYFGALNVLLSSTVSTAAATSTLASLTPASSISNAASTSPTATTTPAPPAKVSGAVIGGAVGGTLALVSIMALVIFLLCRRRRKKNKARSDEAQEHSNMSMQQDKGFVVGPYSPQSNAHSPPPQYSSEYRSSYHPQELPADSEAPGSARSRYSELQGSTIEHRISELYASGSEPRELESPSVSPRPVQSEFASDQAKQNARGVGLGLTTVSEDDRLQSRP